MNVAKTLSFPTSFVLLQSHIIEKSAEELVGIRNYRNLLFMSLHHRVTKPGIYFIKFTNHAWIPLLQQLVEKGDWNFNN